MRRGCHLVTDQVIQALASTEFARIRIGWLQLFLKHTSASLLINENADPDVRVDLEMAFTRLVPESMPYQHTCEGPDDMPAHVKVAMVGNSLTIPVTDGQLNLGTWQGVYLFEHRNHATRRRVVLTAHGTT